MIRLLHIIILALIPILLIGSQPSENYKDRLEGRWFETWNGHEIKVKEKRYGLKIKGINGHRKWTKFDHVRNNKFRDCDNNLIRIHSSNFLTYVSSCGRYKSEYRRGNSGRHNNYFGHSQCLNPSVSYEEEYIEYYQPRTYERQDRNLSRRERFHVRELDEYIDIEFTSYGLRARRSERDWVEYKQNRYRKNEFKDHRGNRYIRLDDRTFRWKNKHGDRSLILSKRR